MVKLGETNDGRIIEVPDIILFGAAILLFVLFFTLATKNKWIMRKLIWKLYNDNMISEEVAHMLLDKYYE